MLHFYVAKMQQSGNLIKILKYFYIYLSVFSVYYKFFINIFIFWHDYFIYKGIETQNIKNNINNKVQKIDFNRVVIFQISKLINDGRAIFGMLIANEYLENSSPIRLSLSNMAREIISESSNYILPDSFLNKILDEGYTFSMLSFKEQEILLSLNEKSFERIEKREVTTTSNIINLSEKRTKEGVEKLKNVYFRNRKTSKRVRFEETQNEREERLMLHIVNM